MKLSNFKFKLPAEQVALYPHIEEHTLKSGVTFKLKRPDQCRLMVLHKKSQTIEMYRTDAEGNQLKDADGNPEYLRFVDIVNYFDEGDTFLLAFIFCHFYPIYKIMCKVTQKKSRAQEINLF